MSDLRQRTLTQLRPGDIIEWRSDEKSREQFGEHRRRWRVRGVHLGGLNGESVIALEVADGHRPAWDECDIAVMYVPEVLTRQCRIAGHDDNWSDHP